MGQCFPFPVIGVDYARPIFYCSNTRKDLKAYILLFLCSVSRAVYLELVPNITSEFIRCLKKLIARRGIPKVIYSDYNILVKHSKLGLSCYRRLIRTKKRHHHLNQEQITWKFNIPKAPWWVRWEGTGLGSIRKFDWPNKTKFIQIYWKIGWPTTNL